MKRIVFFGLAIVLLLPLLVSACAVVSPVTTTKSPANGGTPTVTLGIALTDGDFAADAHPVRNVTLEMPGAFTVALAANPSTGYSWTENATVSAPVVAQSSYVYLAPSSTLVGAPGQSVWTFDALKAGTATVSFTYARPWESVPPPRTLTVNVTVK